MLARGPSRLFFCAPIMLEGKNIVLNILILEKIYLSEIITNYLELFPS
jgi:hypothetical protein